jgi:RNA polymerase sigma-70 factor (ECF subfamily)
MTRPGGHSESELLRRVEAGDEEAFGILYHQFQGPVYRFALHMAGSTAVAEDATQEVFMALIERRTRFDASRGSLRAYLLGTARHILLHRFERERRFVALPEPDGANGSGSSARAFERAVSAVAPIDLARVQSIERVRAAVLSLPTDYRETVVLCELQELSYEEAASVLDCPVGTVRSRLHRGRAMLAEKLREIAEPARRASTAVSRVRGTS